MDTTQDGIVDGKTMDDNVRESYSIFTISK